MIFLFPIEVIETIDKPWFKAKDVLKILGYSENLSTIKNNIHKTIPGKYKKERCGLIPVIGVPYLQLKLIKTRKCLFLNGVLQTHIN